MNKVALITGITGQGGVEVAELFLEKEYRYQESIGNSNSNTKFMTICKGCNLKGAVSNGRKKHI